MRGITQDELAARIARMRKDLAEFIEQANRAIAAREGAIQVLETLRNELDSDERDDSE